jgi:hypothetical protein
MRADPTLPLLFTRDQAMAAGMSRHQIGHRVRTRCWRPLRRAVYIEERRYAALSPREQHATAVVATLMARDGVGDSQDEVGDSRNEIGSSRNGVRASDNEVVASHLSAAVAYGWVLPLTGAGPVTLTHGNLNAATRQTHLRGREEDLTVQVASLPTSDVRTLSIEIAGTRWGVRTTSRARTVADNLRHLPNADGVALADSALRAASVSYEQIAAVLDRQARWPYAERGRRALPLVDPRRESWLESFSFVTLHQIGLPMPEPQVSLFDARGQFVARVDGWLEDEALALESDGRAKYFLDEQPLSEDIDLAADEVLNVARRRMIKEKERRDRIVDLGAELVRWGTREIVRSPRDVLARVAAARRRGDAARFTGTTAYLPAPPWLAATQRRVS